MTTESNENPSLRSQDINPRTRRLRLGMVGGGPGAFIGAVHRMAARLDDHYELVAGALCSDPARSRAAGLELHLASDRAYGSYPEMSRAEAARADGIDAVAIVTPNNSHYEIAKEFLNARIHVICDKPLTATLDEALKLAELVRNSGLIFGLTHNYTGHPMVRQARQMVAEGEIGEIRVIQVEYVQDWLSTPLESTGHKQASWRTDPERSGPAGALGDIGSHAFHIMSFVTGLACRCVAADLSTFVRGRRLDDNAQALLRFENGARGVLWASQVAPGNGNNLRFRIYGEKGGLEWQQEEPNILRFALLGKPVKSILRAGPGTNLAATQSTRLPVGHPEGYLEAFAQLYSDLAEQIRARIAKRRPAPSSLLVPTVEDGVRVMRFISGALESSRQNASWVQI